MISEINKIKFVLFCTTENNSILCVISQKNSSAVSLIFKLAEL